MKSIDISIQATNNPAILKFVSSEILTSGSNQFNNIDDAKNAPLVQELFHLPFVKKVLVSANFIAIERYNIVEWSDVQDELKEQLQTYLRSGAPILTEERKTQKTPVEIYAEVTPNPSVLKFVSNKRLVQKDAEFKNIEEAQHAPLATALFNFPFVKEIFLSENYVSVTKYDVVEWEDITLEIRSFIKEYIANGGEVVNEAIEKSSENTTETAMESSSNDPVSLQIINILDEYIRPAVAADGGNILFQNYEPDTKVVSVILQGACSGCPSSTITLKNGIENMLKQMIPGKIDEVVALNY